MAFDNADEKRSEETVVMRVSAIPVGGRLNHRHEKARPVVANSRDDDARSSDVLRNGSKWRHAQVSAASAQKAWHCRSIWLADHAVFGVMKMEVSISA